MKYEILDKDTSGVIVSSDGKLYRVEYPSRDVRTIGMTTSKVVEYIFFEVGEKIEDMAGVSVDEYIEACNEVEQSMTNQGKIVYTYKKNRHLSFSGFGNLVVLVSGYINSSVSDKSVFHIDSFSGKL